MLHHHNYRWGGLTVNLEKLTSLDHVFKGLNSRQNKPLPMSVAHLTLYHPTKPSSKLALEYLKNEHVWNVKLSNCKSDNPESRFITSLASLTLDTIQNLMQTGRFTEAQKLIERFKTHLAPIGPHLGAVAF